METIKPKGIRPFIGCADFEEAKGFYRQLGFVENWSGSDMSYFDLKGFGFYLQDAYVQEWVENMMLFLEVDNLETTLEHFKSLNLKTNFPKVRISEIIHNDWGSEFYLHDPSGILWHIGQFNS
ncbi:VOC family protein [Nonlabens antarcticus]|uniref:glyoxalase n=1 Tax=Nonlabens antarcticus TaxID=392714 RepID=UPI001890D1B9|nr:glyoxalase [Nonlabens antarcticus]